MRKPPSLRAHLTAALPQYRQSPENLLMFVMGGHVATTGTAALGWQWEYTLRIVLCDFTGHPDAVIGPTLVWLRAHQPDLLNHPQRQKQALKVNAEYLNTKAMDLVLDVQLSESVHARPMDAGNGAFELVHRLEPPLEAAYPLPLELYIKGELVAKFAPAEGQQGDVSKLYLNGEQLAAWPPLDVVGQ